MRVQFLTQVFSFLILPQLTSEMSAYRASPRPGRVQALVPLIPGLI